MSLLFVESNSSSFTGDTSSDPASSSSTPPTTVDDTASVQSESPKQDVITVAHAILGSPVLSAVDAAEPDADVDADVLVHVGTDADADAPASLAASPARSRRARTSAPVYNLAQLSGTAIHGKRRSKGDVVSNRRRRTIASTIRIAAEPVFGSDDISSSRKTATKKSGREGIDALDLHRSLRNISSPRTRHPKAESPRATRTSSRLSVGAPITPISAKLATAGKRNRKNTDKTNSKIPFELKRLQDTKEYAHLDEKPVVYTVWANGKYVNPNAPKEPPAPKGKETPAEEPEPEEPAEPITKIKKRRVKKFLDKGLYSGQDAPLDASRCLTTAERKRLAQLPELIPSSRANKTMPLPIFTGLRMLIAGRDFKLPYNVCNPLPPGQPKPDEWKKMTKNRFIGNSKEIWRKSPHFHDMSKCVCDPEDGCGESCQNRIMLYECDEMNCNIGKQHCSNRAFAELTARRNRGGKYRVGVEVIKTSDRGYGVRSNRCFEPNQIIMEYAGEIITEEECERRMNEIYRDNECYYLMSFDQNMIIDATTGSIARFVNHSCNPNCRMIKWIVSGQPRMALFAGDRPIMTGDELTYDYNFDPFSAKNVQKCLCGQPNCRGVLGPKPREVKVPKTDLKTAVKATVKAGKRKLQEMIGSETPEGNSKATKKRKTQPATGAKKSLANTSTKVAKTAASALKKGMSSISVATKKAALGAKSPANRKASKGVIVSKATQRVVKTYGKSKASPRRNVTTKTKTKSTIIARGAVVLTSGNGNKKPSTARKSTGSPKTTPVKQVKATVAVASPVQSVSSRSGRIRKPSSKLASPNQGVEVSPSGGQNEAH